MAYDKKSDIGPFVSQPGNTGLDQLNIFEQKLVQIDGGMSRQKVVDMLDMDQFGHNVSMLRRSLSVLEAEQCNTDREYGIMQCEDNFEFTSTSGESIPTYTIDNTTSTNIFSVCGTTASTPDSALTLSFNSTNPLYIIPSVFYEDTKKVDSVQYIGTSSSLNTVGGRTVTESGTGTLDANFYLTSTILGSQSFQEINDIYITVDNRGTADSITIGFDYQVRIGDAITSPTESFGPGNYKTWYPYGSTTDLYSLGNFYISTSNSANAGKKYYFRLGQYAFQPDGDMEFVRLDLCEANSTATVVTWLPSYDCPDPSYETAMIKTNDPTFVFPECTIRIGLKKAESSDFVYGEFRLTKAKTSSQAITVSDLTGNVFDNKNHDIFYAQKFVSTATNIVPTRIKSSPKNVMLVCPGSLESYIYNYAESSILQYYFKLIDISESRSLGLAKYQNGTYAICVKDSNSYYTAKGSNTIYQNTKVNKISIIQASSFSISFTVDTDGWKSYYMFKKIYDFNGGPLFYASYHDKYVFYSFDILNGKVSTIQDPVISITNSGLTGADELSCIPVALNDDIYSQSEQRINLKPGTTASFIGLCSKKMFGSSILRMLSTGEYVVQGLTLPFMMAYNFMIGSDIQGEPTLGQQCFSLYSIPMVDPTTKMFAQLPLKLIDEYPAIAFNSGVGNDSFVLGKTKFVSYSGSLYEAGGLNLVGDKSKLYLSDTGKIYQRSGFFFLSKGTDSTDEYGLTNVYSFTELGLTLMYTIEDQILCNPVKISIGMLACGKNGIWLCTNENARRLWMSSNIVDASLKTDLDNSCVAVIDNGSVDFSQLVDSEGNSLVDSSGNNIGIGSPLFSVITVNQFGYISSQVVPTTMSTSNFIDVGSTSELFVIDLSGTNSVYYMDKNSSIGSEYYTIQSNQQIEFYGDPVYAELVAIKMFYRGSGTIQLHINGTIVETKSLSKVTRYTEVVFHVDATMNMIDYKLVCSSGIKVMQRILGIIMIKEEYYG